MRDETFEDYEDLQLIFDLGLATEKNAVGLGDDTDAQTFGAEDNAPCELYTKTFGNARNVDGSQASGSWDSVMSQSKKGPLEKLPPKKRAKGGDCGNSSNSSIDGNRMENAFNEMIMISNHVVSLIQQREERQQREAESREAEKRKNNVWEAIKEISHLEENVRRPITRNGYDYIHNVLREDPQHFRQLYRMYPDVFLKLCALIRDETHLKDTRFICVEEMVSTFLVTVGQNSRYCHTKDTFKRSKFATSTNFHKVLRAINIIAPSMMVKPNLTVATKIRESTRFYPYFKDCLGAIDGTHIPAMVSKCDAPSYRNRKGVISQNVLVVCNFDMKFIYVLSGWEGSAHNLKVLYDALTRRTNKFEVPHEKFYLTDCGFANRRKFLAPFRGTKYHLQEFVGHGCDPETLHELFNHRHAALRNVIERIFGVFKSRFLIFKSAPPFPFKTQAEIVLACVALHNFLHKHCRSDEFPVEVLLELST